MFPFPSFVSGLFVLFLNSLRFAQLSAAEFDFTVSVAAGKIECFYQPVVDPSHVTMELDFMVLDGGPDLDISFTVKDPSEKLLASESRQSEGTKKFDVSIAKGDYSICFDNSFSFNTDKVVYFEVLLADKDGSSDDLSYASLASAVKDLQMSLEDFRTTTIKIKNNLNTMEQHQSQLRGLELRDRSIMEDNFERVNFWSCTSVICLLIVAVLQIFLVRSFFEEHPRLARLFT